MHVHVLPIRNVQVNILYGKAGSTKRRICDRADGTMCAVSECEHPAQCEYKKRHIKVAG